MDSQLHYYDLLAIVGSLGSFPRKYQFLRCGVVLMIRGGLVSLEGVRPLQPISDSIGIMARSVSDIQLVAKTLGVMRSQIPNLSHTSLKQCQFGFFKTEVFDKHGSESIKFVWHQAKDALTKAGASVEEVDLSEEYNGWEGTGGRLDTSIDAGGSVACFRECAFHRDLVWNAVLERVERPISRAELTEIMDDLAALRPKFDKIARGYDAIITPSSLVEAPRLPEKDVPDYSALWSALGVPMINVSGFGGVNGLPIGLLLVAPRYVLRGKSVLMIRYDDYRLLHVAKMVAKVFIEAGKGGLRKVSAPDGVVHIKP
jgi:amidase